MGCYFYREVALVHDSFSDCVIVYDAETFSRLLDTTWDMGIRNVPS